MRFDHKVLEGFVEEMKANGVRSSDAFSMIEKSSAFNLKPLMIGGAALGGLGLTAAGGVAAYNVGKKVPGMIHDANRYVENYGGSSSIPYTPPPSNLDNFSTYTQWQNYGGSQGAPPSQGNSTTVTPQNNMGYGAPTPTGYKPPTYKTKEEAMAERTKQMQLRDLSARQRIASQDSEVANRAYADADYKNSNPGLFSVLADKVKTNTQERPFLRTLASPITYASDRVNTRNADNVSNAATRAQAEAKRAQELQDRIKALQGS